MIKREVWIDPETGATIVSTDWVTVLCEEGLFNLTPAEAGEQDTLAAQAARNFYLRTEEN